MDAETSLASTPGRRSKLEAELARNHRSRRVGEISPAHPEVEPAASTRRDHRGLRSARWRVDGSRLGLALAGLAIVGGLIGVYGTTDIAAAANGKLRLDSNRHGEVSLNGVKVTTIGQMSRRISQRPASRKPDVYGMNCKVRWKMGLIVHAQNFDGDDPCNLRTGYVATLFATGKRWTTARGLRAGDSLARLKARYPNARRENGRWTLTTRFAYGSHNPIISARVVRGRVQSIVAYVAAGGP